MEIYHPRLLLEKSLLWHIALVRGSHYVHNLRFNNALLVGCVSMTLAWTELIKVQPLLLQSQSQCFVIIATIGLCG